MNSSDSPSVEYNSRRSSMNANSTTNSSTLTHTSQAMDLSHQLEAANRYVLESGLISNAHLNQSRFSLRTQNRDSIRLSNDSNSRILHNRDSNSEKPDETVISTSDEELSDEDYILEFAKRCAAFPGRKPILHDIENTLKEAQKPQLPIILNQAFEKINSNDRTEATLPPALYTALLAGTCKSIITESDYRNDTQSQSPYHLSEDYERDPTFITFLSSLSCFRNLSMNQLQQLIPLFVPMHFEEHQIIVKEEELVDHFFIILSDYPYGVLVSGSIYGASNLVAPQLATKSLFSATRGMLITLSQSDYMSVISLGEEEQKESIDIHTIISSLNAPIPASTSIDPLYDSQASVNTTIPEQQTSTLLDLYATEIERLHDLLISDNQQYYSIIHCFESLFCVSESSTSMDMLCNELTSLLQLSGLSFYFTKGNQELYQYIHRGIDIVLDPTKVLTHYYTVNESLFYDTINIPLYSNTVLVGLIQVTKTTDAIDHMIFENKEITLLQQLSLSLAAVLPKLCIQPEQFTYDVQDQERIVFTLESITLFKTPKTQIYYSNNVLKFASFQKSTCTSNYYIIPISGCDCFNINKNLASICKKQYTTSIQINHTNNNTVLMARLVLGSSSYVGVLPLYDETGYLIDNTQTLLLYDENEFSFDIPSSYQQNNNSGVIQIKIAPREKRIRYSYVYRESEIQVDKKDNEVLHKIELKRIDSELSDGEKSLLVKYATHCNHPFLPYFLCEAIDYYNPASLNRVYSSFPSALQKIEIAQSTALENNDLNNHHALVSKLLLLLSRRNCDVILREMVVNKLERILSNEECILYVSQLVQATKWDTHDFSALSRFLIRKAIECHDFAYMLYWQLQSNTNYALFHKRFQHYMTVLMKTTKTLKIEVGSEYLLVKQLMTIASQVKDIANQEDRNLSLFSQLQSVNLSPPFSLPLYSSLELAGINYNKCKVMSSKKLPLFLSFIVNKHDQMTSLIGASSSSIIDEFNVLVKKGDDIRKDQLIVAIIRILGILLEENGFSNYFQYYACLSTSEDEGLIEIVNNAVTIGDVYNDANNIANTVMHVSKAKHTIMNKINTAKRVLLHNFAIQEYLITSSAVSNRSLLLERQRREELLRLDAPRVLCAKETKPCSGESIEDISMRFAASLGQYLMFVYLTGIGDRHNDNLMINQLGYFHIDFGHILGHYKSKLGFKRETHSFLFTKAYYNALGGENHPYFKEFMKNTLGCYKVIRKNYLLFYALFELMRDSGIDEISDNLDTQFFLDACRLDLSEEIAEKWMYTELMKAVNSKLPILNDFFHVLRHAFYVCLKQNTLDN